MVIQTQNTYLLIILPAIVLWNASVTIHKEQKSNINIVYDDLYISLFIVLRARKQNLLYPIL